MSEVAAGENENLKSLLRRYNMMVSSQRDAVGNIMRSLVSNVSGRKPPRSARALE